ncbi:ABC transporter ATP-binding protein [Leptospira borgpetersenii]|uniref:ABC transporter ATP-binding protein n=1 Tax=Leptospira borgpetersenii TaxID=174 RepID=UPI00077387B1|nr:ABC transporter ATP-binding protein [Leptospira borgpetersenii]MBE8401372.1 ABC transporter ATP-binding protein [Leptospira borgpetersenii serovar Tarassovi]MBE8404378.1 ABC transporter ATP-binding protein [Leptospira borgpetersenii serovar Tarassovi]MBE8407531.1 ABC transporter ATP-binding protein [Leptospira borgpetersenii serovar Tarassovi]MBE8413808.1 ABC transporter ATP-binding protein [Leptospira borgpetersenii serovar Tarassovi]MBE8415833.1 ABC transporter ATP-binding protein [Leptos
MVNPAISVSQLSKFFPGKTAVSGLSFEIPKGRITGLLGPNGAGKTTTLKLLTGSLHPNQGTIRYDGLDLLENKIEIQKKIGYLSESSPIYWNLTVFEYLSFLGKAKGISIKNLSERIDFVSSLLKLKTASPIGLLSKGFRQRVALAGVLIQDPEYIILDEPSSGLDPIQIAELKQLIRTLGKNKTILLSSHILQEVEDLCDHILVLSEGKLIADSSLASISRGEGSLVLAETDLDTLKVFFSDTDYEIETTGKSEGSFLEFRIRSHNTSSEKIFQLLKKARFQVRSLAPEKNSLESVFQSLTLTK